MACALRHTDADSAQDVLANQRRSRTRQDQVTTELERLRAVAALSAVLIPTGVGVAAAGKEIARRPLPNLGLPLGTPPF